MNRNKSVCFLAECTIENRINFIIMLYNIAERNKK